MNGILASSWSLDMVTYWVLSMNRKEVDMESAREDANVNGVQYIGFNTMYCTDCVGDDVGGQK